ncbi:MAG: formylglycine-generating enzyme family protein [Bacteroidales bacterium]|nr:formylglycine-generating enzyme family protein [Bacteroidales bacterium]
MPNHGGIIRFYVDQCRPLEIVIPDFVVGGVEYRMHIIFEEKFAFVENNIYDEQEQLSVFDQLLLPITIKGITFNMISVAGGSFDMGSNEGYNDEKPIHNVFINDFYIGETEVTQGLWKAVIGNNPSVFSSKGDDYPVESVSWYDAVMFCNKLSELENKPKVYTITNIKYDDCKQIISADVKADFSKNGYRLPTEAEWEYAARGGNKSNGYKYSGSNKLADVAWYGCFDLSDANRTLNEDVDMPVKQKKSNELGLYDMSGNVWELCWDWYQYDYYVNSPSNNPLGPSSGEERVMRGGAFNTDSYYCSRRGISKPNYRGDNLGFRLLLSSPPK